MIGFMTFLKSTPMSTIESYPNYKALAIQRRRSRPKTVFFNGGQDFINIPLDLKQKKNLKPTSRDSNASTFVIKENPTPDENLLLLEHEHAFIRTLKSCTDESCFHSPDGNGNYRIAIMAPPGAIGDTFYALLNTALDSIYDPVESPDERKKIQLIRTTHVPPYGYGRNHGWTKIIRILATPLPVAITDVMMTYGEIKNSHGQSALKEDRKRALLETERIQSTAEAIMRQIVRFQSRLTHVAAHTSLLTMDISSMELDYAEAFSNVIYFILHDNEGNLMVQTKAPNTNVKIKMDDFSEAIYNADTRSSELISELWQVGILEDILKEEMLSTNNLKDWPSLSFWDMTSFQIKDEESIPFKVAKAMVPDCENEHVKCTIGKDLCEIKGDAKCIK